MTHADGYGFRCAGVGDILDAIGRRAILNVLLLLRAAGIAIRSRKVLPGDFEGLAAALLVKHNRS